MSGSIKFFVYTTDGGLDAAIKRDESNTEAVNGGVQDYPNSGVSINELPRNIKPRYARFTSADGLVSRNVVVLTPTIFAGIPANLSSFVDSVSGQTLFLKAKYGELVSVPFGIDTAQQDGDAS